MKKIEFNFELNELTLFRQVLDIIDIKGKDAKYISNLQFKLENYINQLEQKKEEELKEILKNNPD